MPKKKPSDYPKGTPQNPITVEEALADIGMKLTPEGAVPVEGAAQASPDEQKPRARGSRAKPGEGGRTLTPAEHTALIGMRANARNNPSEGACAENAVRTAAGRIAVSLWRQPDGREGVVLQSKGTKAPLQRRVRGWARAAWPELADADLQYSSKGNTHIALTKEAVEL
jgi:hypothetical protein